MASDPQEGTGAATRLGGDDALGKDSIMVFDPLRGAEADPDDDLIEDDPDDGDDGRCPDCGADFTEEHELDCGYDDEDEDPEFDEDEDVEDFA